jgi:hypothetical protein
MYYGSCSLNQAGKRLSVCLEGSSFTNLLAGEQKRNITSLTKAEPKFTDPRTCAGVNRVLMMENGFPFDAKSFRSLSEDSRPSPPQTEMAWSSSSAFGRSRWKAGAVRPRERTAHFR